MEKDLALTIVPEHAQEIDPKAEGALVRKLDLIIIPWLSLGWMLQCYDKAILGAAAVLGMIPDLHLAVEDTTTHPPTTSAGRLSWAASLFYFGMLAGQYPMIYALQKFKLGRVLGGVMTLWAVTTMLTASVTSWKGLYAQRFFLGFLEAIVPPGFACIVTSYYTQEEQTARQICCC